MKCAKISGDTSGNYHPHGESVIYPTLVRMAQEWNMRHVLIDKQGNGTALQNVLDTGYFDRIGAGGDTRIRLKRR